MIRILFVLLGVFLCVAVIAAQSAPEVGSEMRLHLKSGDVLEGRLLRVDEVGLRLDIGDGVELYIRWVFTRGDRHLELRRGATDYGSVDSILKFAEFCHEFALPEEEYKALAAVLRLDAKHEEALARIRELEPVPGVEVPGVTPDRPAPPDSEPPPAIQAPRVYVESEDDTAARLVREEFQRRDYRLGEAGGYDYRVHLDVKLTLVRNPTFMGAELYAVYDGELRYRVFRAGESTPFAQGLIEAEDIQRDTRVEAADRCRRDLLEDAFRRFYGEIRADR